MAFNSRARLRHKKKYIRGFTFLKIFYKHYWNLYRLLFGNGSFFDLQNAHEKNVPQGLKYLIRLS